jgi:uncharacterized protein (TIGR00725 family)
MVSGIKTRLPIVGVMGSGSSAHKDRAAALGEWLAGEAVHLLTGGGGGVMESVSRAFYEVSYRKGLVIGIIPGTAAHPDCTSPPGYPNPWVEIPIYTHLPLSGVRGTEPLSRNHINILSSHVIIALPGSHGTAAEVALAIDYGRPVIAFLDSRKEIDDLPDSTRVESDFKEIKNFVRARIRAGN